MKQLTLFLTAALLIGALTACGCTAKQAGETVPPAGSQTDDALPEAPDTGSDSMDHYAPGDGTLADEAGDAVQDGIDDVTDAIDEAGDALTDPHSGSGQTSGTTGGVSYEDMLRNARVHDRDGDLTDHENAGGRSGL